MAEKVLMFYSALMDCTILVSLTFSIVYWSSLKKIKYLRFLPFYTGISFIVDTDYYFHNLGTLKELPENIFTIGEFILFYNFYSYVLVKRENKIILQILIVIFLIFFVIILAFLQNKYSTESFIAIYKNHIIVEQIVICNILLVIPTLIYYKSLFNPPYKKNLTNDPIFLIMTGILFCFSLSTPIFLFSRMLVHYNREIYYYLFMINSTAYLTMHVFFIKAYINIKSYA